MPNSIIKYNVSLNSYQNLDGSNLTVCGLEEKRVFDKISAGAFVGFGTDFENGPKLVFDFKGSMNYDKQEKLNQNLRVRNTFGGGNNSTQIRYSPLSVNIPLGETTDFYVNPHYSGKYSYKTSDWSHSAGIFAGVTQKISENTSVSIEGQRYNLQNIKDNSGKNWGINMILSHNF